MYQELYERLVMRLSSLGFANVGSALAEIPPLPAVQLYLHDDKEITQAPQPFRELQWVIQLTVGPDSEGDAKIADLHRYLDTLRDGFAGWHPTGSTGIVEPISVPKITLSGHKDHGPTEYLLFLVCRIVPAAFTL